MLAKPLIDSHAHLYMDEFKLQINDIINEMKEYNVGLICNVGYDLDSSKQADEFNIEGVEYYKFAGIHPHYSDKITDEDINTLRTMLISGRYNGLGEVGLDRYWHKDEKIIETQKIVFKKQLSIAEELRMPVMLHIRNAYDEAIDIVSEYKLPSVEFHSFTGNKNQLNKIYSLGYYFGINGVITFKNSELKECLKEEFFDSMLIETDSPYLTPVPMRGKRNRSDYVRYIYDFIASQYNIDKEKLRDIVYDNFKRFVSA